MKRQATCCTEILANHIPHKGFLSRLCTDPSKCKSEKTKKRTKDFSKYWIREYRGVANKHMKSYSSSGVFIEMQIKTTVKHTIYTEQWVTLNTDSTRCWPRWRATAVRMHCRWEYKMAWPLCKTAWQLHSKINLTHTLWPNTPKPGYLS